MKKIFKWFGLAVIITAIISFTANTGDHQNQNGKQKDQSKNQNKGNDQNPGKGNKGNPNQGNNPGQGKGKDQGNNPGQGNDKNQGKKDQDGKGNPNRDDVTDEKIRNDNKSNSADRKQDGYSWNRENFRDRNKIRNQQKVTICHKFNRGNGDGVTISVSENAVNAHLDHGDITGSCPASNNDRYSDRYLRERENYYNTLQNGQEQVIYSRSILDYALTRLADSRQQLVVYEAANYPPAEIERRRLVVTELEQNVSLLESLLTVAAEFVVSKLMN